MKERILRKQGRLVFFLYPPDPLHSKEGGEDNLGPREIEGGGVYILITVHYWTPMRIEH
jgi:hypothetical protein